MSNMQNGTPSTAKVWMKPELKRIEAGSAENGPRAQFPDGTVNQFSS